jgi:hypothetical protein
VELFALQRRRYRALTNGASVQGACACRLGPLGAVPGTKSGRLSLLSRMEESAMPKENDLEGQQDQGGKHGGQKGMPKPEPDAPIKTEIPGRDRPELQTPRPRPLPE